MKNFSIIFLLCFSINLQGFVNPGTGGNAAQSAMAKVSGVIESVTQNLGYISAIMDYAENQLCGATSLSFNGTQVANGLIINSTGYANCNGGLMGDYQALNNQLEAMIAKIANVNYHSAAGQCASTDVTEIGNMQGSGSSPSIGQITNVLNSMICLNNHQTPGYVCQAPTSGQCDLTAALNYDSNKNVIVCVPPLPVNTPTMTLGVNASFASISDTIVAQMKSSSTLLNSDKVVAAVNAYTAALNNPALNAWATCFGDAQATGVYTKTAGNAAPWVCPASQQIQNDCGGCYNDDNCDVQINPPATVTEPICSGNQLVQYLEAFTAANQAFLALYDALIILEPSTTIQPKLSQLLPSDVINILYTGDTTPNKLPLPSYCSYWSNNPTSSSQIRCPANPVAPACCSNSSYDPLYCCQGQVIDPTNFNKSYLPALTNTINALTSGMNGANTQYTALISRMNASQKQTSTLLTNLNTLSNSTAFYPGSKTIGNSLTGLLNYCSIEMAKEAAYFSKTFGLAETIIGTVLGCLAFTGVGAIGLTALTVLYGVVTTVFPVVNNVTTGLFANFIVYGMGKGELPPAPNVTGPLFVIPLIGVHS